MSEPETFRALILKQRTLADGRLVPMRDVASACGVSRAWLYVLMAGQFVTVPSDTEEALATGLNVTMRRLRRALRVTRQLAEIGA